MTDREFMIAIYKAVEKLYLATTGERLTVEIEMAEGYLTITDYSGGRSEVLSS